MRTLLIALLTLTVGFTAQAHRFKGNSQFNIRMADLSTYTVVFNNTTYFATEWVKIYNVPPGKHYLRIEETVQTRGRGMRATGHRLIYEGWVTVPAASRVNTRVNFNRNFMVARIDRMDCRKPYGNQGYGRGGNYGPDRGQGNNQPGYGEDYDHGYDPEDPYTHEYGGGQGRPQNPDDGGVYDDGTYGDSQLRAKTPNQTKTTQQKVQKEK